ncbi:hypothetical protein CPC08DRAFT_610942, partial [Agrocybe pediades]
YLCGLDGCTQKTKSTGDMRRHRKTKKHQDKSYFCPICSLSYTREDALIRHWKKIPRCGR